MQIALRPLSEIYNVYIVLCVDYYYLGEEEEKKRWWWSVDRQP